MNTPSQHSLSVANRRLRLRARGDVQAERVAFADQSGHVLKDPVTLEMFHLTAEEYFLFERLRRPATLAELQSEFEHRFAPRRISLETLQGYLGQLHESGLLVSEAAGQGEQLARRASRRRRLEWLQSAGRILAIRFPGVDATRTLDRLYPWCRWLFSRTMLVVAAALVLYAGGILLAHAEEVAARLPSLDVLLSPRHLVLLIATIAGVKLLHELGHGLTCKYFGGRCHEMGLMLLVFAPTLYCDVSDVWRLPSKWQRMAVSAAGMGVELLLAALATIAWWHTQPGLLNTWCLHVVLVCSVGTLLVNANPLLRYDGYYLLADWMEVPNLGSRARGLLAERIRHWLLAQPTETDPLLGPGRERSLMAYAVAAKLYLAVLLVGIFLLMVKLARPMHLENLVYTLALVAVAGFAIPAAMSWGRWLGNPAVRARVRMGRLAGVGVVAVAMLMGLMNWPITRHVSAPAVVVPDDASPVVAAASGELRFAVQPGTHVEAGDVVARLTDPKVELALAELEARCREHRLHREQLLALRVLDDRAGVKLPAVEAALADAESQLAELEREAERLELRSPSAGQVIAPHDRLSDNAKSGPHHAEAIADRQLQQWSGSPLDAENRGCWVPSGTMFCTVANPQQLEAWLAVDESDVAQLEPGQPVRLLLEMLPTRVLEGEVVEVARRAECRSDEKQGQPADCYHVVRVALEPNEALLMPGARGRAKVQTSRTTVAAEVVRFLRQTFRLPW